MEFEVKKYCQNTERLSGSEVDNKINALVDVLGYSREEAVSALCKQEAEPVEPKTYTKKTQEEADRAIESLIAQGMSRVEAVMFMEGWVSKPNKYSREVQSAFDKLVEVQMETFGYSREEVIMALTKEDI